MNNDIKDIIPVLNGCVALGVEVEYAATMDALQAYIALIKEWNRYATLVSMGDAENGLVSHCIDSISLAPYFHAFLSEHSGGYIDIGTGGGFPAIPLCILFPQLQTLLIERNTKKTVFLKKIVGKLELKSIEVENESFDGRIDTDIPKLITSRAVEKPALVIPDILESLSSLDIYLCQSEAIHEIPKDLMEEFSVVELKDAFSEFGMRRNKLYQIARIT